MACLPINQAENEDPKVSSVYTISIATPTAGWRIDPFAAYQVDEEIWILYLLTPPKEMSAQVISEVKSSLCLYKKATPARQFVLGKSWSWNSDPEVTFLESIQEIEDRLDGVQIPFLADSQSEYHF